MFLDSSVAYGRFFGNSAIDEDEGLADAFYIQRAVHDTLGDENETGIIDFNDFIAERHFYIGIYLSEVIAIADEVYPLVEGVLMSRRAHANRLGDTGET